MKSLIYIGLSTLMLFLFNPLTVSANNNLEDFIEADNIDSLFSELSDTDALDFDDQWVLIILNKNLHESNILIDYLADASTNTESLMIMILGSQTDNKPLEKNKNLSGLKLFNLSDSGILPFLETNATPLIVGMNKSTVKWKIAGFNENSEFLHNLINRWSLK